MRLKSIKKLFKNLQNANLTINGNPIKITIHENQDHELTVDITTNN